MFGYNLYAISIQYICGSHLAIWCFELELVSGTNHFDSGFHQFTFEILPIVSAFGIIILIVYGSHNVSGGEPPFGLFFVPHGSHLTIVEV